jgi:tyrosyl-tRNA synthetase
MENKEQLVEEILSRSIASVLPTKEGLREVLMSDKKLRIYIGADATGPELHLGHATNFMLLERFRKLGHEVIVLFGDFTAMLGDPSERAIERKALTKEEVEKNIETWKSQVSKLLDFETTENPALLKRNSEWLASMNLGDVINLAQNFTVQQMLERDMFEKRIAGGVPVYLNEFLYPLLQGYDSVAMDVDIEIGGTDQTFNMLAGRTLQKHFHHKEKFVIATTLLEHPVTKKKIMSKSEGNYIALNDSPQEMFGKTMALPDEMITQMFVDCTYVPMAEIGKMAEDIVTGGNPRDAKVRLAKEIVRLYHGDAEADKAEQYFIDTFSKGHVPEEVREVAPQHEPALDGFENVESFIARIGLATSKSDARRKIEQGGVTLGEEKIVVGSRMFTKEDNGKVMKVGKKDFVKIVF